MLSLISSMGMRGSGKKNPLSVCVCVCVCLGGGEERNKKFL